MSAIMTKAKGQEKRRRVICGEDTGSCDREREGKVGRKTRVRHERALDPVGGRKPTRQLTLQPEAIVGANRAIGTPEPAMEKVPLKGISERADRNEN